MSLHQDNIFQIAVCPQGNLGEKRALGGNPSEKIVPIQIDKSGGAGILAPTGFFLDFKEIHIGFVRVYSYSCTFLESNKFEKTIYLICSAHSTDPFWVYK